MSAPDPKTRDAFVTAGISEEAFKIEARKRAKEKGITTRIHFHSYLTACGDNLHELIGPDAAN